MFDSLREFIAKADELGECRVIKGADWNLESLVMYGKK